MFHTFFLFLFLQSHIDGFQFGGVWKKDPPSLKKIVATPIVKTNQNPVLTVCDPIHGNRIHLVGVSHGSATSANLVKETINEVKPAVVVLELCDDRFWSISLDAKIRPRGNETFAKSFDEKLALIESRQQTARLASANFGLLAVFSQLTNTFRFASGQGFVGGMFVLLGLMVGNLQRITRSLGSDAEGDEFTTAMMESEKLNIPIRLGDASQNDTLSSIRGVLSRETFIPAQIGQGALFLAFSALGMGAAASNKRLAQVIPTSILSESQWVSIPKAYAEHRSMLKSLMPLFVALFVTTTITYFPFADVLVTGNLDLDGSNEMPTTVIGSLLALVSSDPPPEVEMFVSSMVDLFSVLILIRLAKVIGTDRDTILAKNIQLTAQEFPGKDIVVVIGMLHCNGVARWLLSGVDPMTFDAETTEVAI